MAEKYERGSHCKNSRAGYYQRGLEMKAGKVTLEVPKLHKSTFETAITKMATLYGTPCQVFSHIPCHKMRIVAALLKAIYAQENLNEFLNLIKKHNSYFLKLSNLYISKLDAFTLYENSF